MHLSPRSLASSTTVGSPQPDARLIRVGGAAARDLLHGSVLPELDCCDANSFPRNSFATVLMLVGAVHTKACFELGGIVYLSGAGVSIIPGTGLVRGRYERLLVRMSNDIPYLSSKDVTFRILNFDPTLDVTFNPSVRASIQRRSIIGRSRRSSIDLSDQRI